MRRSKHCHNGEKHSAGVPPPITFSRLGALPNTTNRLSRKSFENNANGAILNLFFVDSLEAIFFIILSSGNTKTGFWPSQFDKFALVKLLAFQPGRNGGNAMEVKTQDAAADNKGSNSIAAASVFVWPQLHVGEGTWRSCPTAWFSGCVVVCPGKTSFRTPSTSETARSGRRAGLINEHKYHSYYYYYIIATEVIFTEL